MKEKKNYNAPSIKSEVVKVGVFGQYGGGHNRPRPGGRPGFGGHRPGRRH